MKLDTNEQYNITVLPMTDYHESEAVKVTILDSGTHTQEPAP